MKKKKFQLKTPKPIKKVQRKYRIFFGNPIVKLILLPIRIVIGVVNWFLRIGNTLNFLTSIPLAKNKRRKKRPKR